MRLSNQLRQQIEQSRWWRRARPIVAGGFASPNFTGFCHADYSFLFEASEELAEKLENLGAYLSQNPKSIENIRADAATIAHNCQQDMLGAHVAAALPFGFVQGKREHLADARHIVNISLGRFVSTPNFLFDGRAHGIKRNAQLLQRQGSQPISFAQQTR
jgi:hypothetical protein